MVFMWCSYGVRMVFIWCSYDVNMVFVWCSYGVHVIFPVFPPEFEIRSFSF